jgi:AAA ATPase domain
MAETLSIQGFAGIQDLTIELKRINILIGPTASGKSICAKLCFYFKSFIEEIVETILEEKSWDNFIEKMSSKFEMFFSASAWQSNESKVRYSLDGGFIEITCDLNKKPLLQISEHYQRLFFNLYGITQIENQELNYPNQITRQFSQRIRLFGYASQQFNRESTREQFFIPAGRSFFANLENNIFNIILAGASLDPFLIKFGQSYENAKNWIRKHGSFPYSRPVLLETLIPKVSAGTYCYVDNQDCIQSFDGRTTELRRAASGQQEVFPMVMILESIMGGSSMSGNRTVYIEEPEAHLFPETQRDIVNLIAVIFRLSKIDLQFFITTHSPYILGAFNNLLQAGDLYHQNMSATAKAELTRLIPEDMALSIDDITVYSLANGRCSDLISTEMRLIDTNIIDEVANQMSIEFGQLLDLVG